MNKLPMILTRFAINTLDVAPEEASNYIGLTPTRILKKGEPRQPPRPPVAENRWQIESQKRTLYSLDESMAELLKIVWPKHERISSFCAEHHFECLFVSVAWIDDENRPIYEFSPQTLEKMGALHASWIMDLV
jgi:hypothetical protein